MFKIYDQPESPNEGGLQNLMMKRDRQMRGVFKFRSMLERYRQMRGVFKIYGQIQEPAYNIYDEPASPNERVLKQ